MPFRELGGNASFAAAKSAIMQLARFQQCRSIILNTSCRRYRQALAATDVDLQSFDKKFPDLQLPLCGSARAGSTVPFTAANGTMTALQTSVLRPGFTPSELVVSATGA